MNKTSEDKWLYEITPRRGLFEFNFKEIWIYRDLLMLWVKREIVTVYKQTILGPLWYLIQPLFTAIIFTLVFNKLGSIPTGGIPPFLFNLAGITAWNYFKECLTGTSDTFKKHQNIFGKVYFPRIIMPLSVIISNLLKFGIQLFIFVIFYIIYINKGLSVTPNSYLFLLPVYVIMMACLGLGLGMIISSFTTKYRDLTVLVSFGVSLLMYLSAVPYPVSEARNKLPSTVATMVEYNPLTQIIEGFRFMLLDTGLFSWYKLLYTFIISVVILFIGFIVFNKTEKTFIDTI